jgi:hypothetical protein
VAIVGHHRLVEQHLGEGAILIGLQAARAISGRVVYDRDQVLDRKRGISVGSAIILSSNMQLFLALLHLPPEYAHNAFIRSQ